jgi:hypothetical protein
VRMSTGSTMVWHLVQRRTLLGASGGCAILLFSFLLGDTVPWLACGIGLVGLLLIVVSAHLVLPEVGPPEAAKPRSR